MDSCIVLSRRANLGTSSILFLQKAALVALYCEVLSFVSLKLYERCVVTVIRFSDWSAVYFVPILRRLSFFHV